MKAKELAAMLMRNPEANVVFAYPYGDYVGTTAAVEVTEVNRGVTEDWSMGTALKMVEDQDERMVESLLELSDYDEETTKEVIVLT